MKFYNIIFANSLYMDESEAYGYWNYSSFEKALRAARSIVDEFLVHNWQRGVKPDILTAQFALLKPY